MMITSLKLSMSLCSTIVSHLQHYLFMALTLALYAYSKMYVYIVLTYLFNHHGLNNCKWLISVAGIYVDLMLDVVWFTP